MYNSEMQERHDLNRKKLEECFAQLQGMSMVPKSKMFKFYKNASLAFTSLDKEFVECRRLKHISSRYETLEQQYNECITVFEQWSIMATLMY
jgi:hypothetical protein